MVTYDVTNRKSFENVTKWIDDVRTERGQNVIVVLVGNKTDLEEERQVAAPEAEAKAHELDVMWMETSAKTGNNIKGLFRKIAQALPKPSAQAEDGTGTGAEMIPVVLEPSVQPAQPATGGCSNMC